jgi:hypothetical protein
MNFHVQLMGFHDPRCLLGMAEDIRSQPMSTGMTVASMCRCFPFVAVTITLQPNPYCLLADPVFCHAISGARTPRIFV